LEEDIAAVDKPRTVEEEGKSSKLVVVLQLGEMVEQQSN
jgi:hypothetical protein